LAPCKPDGQSEEAVTRGQTAALGVAQGHVGCSAALPPRPAGVRVPAGETKPRTPGRVQASRAVASRHLARVAALKTPALLPVRPAPSAAASVCVRDRYPAGRRRALSARLRSAFFARRIEPAPALAGRRPSPTLIIVRNRQVCRIPPQNRKHFSKCGQFSSISGAAMPRN
jgi:hypothetical protein